MNDLTNKQLSEHSRAFLIVNVLLFLALFASLPGLMQKVNEGRKSAAGWTSSVAIRHAYLTIERFAASLIIIMLTIAICSAGLWLYQQYRPNMRKHNRRMAVVTIALSLLVTGWSFDAYAHAVMGPAIWRTLAFVLPLTLYALAMLRRSQPIRKVPWWLLLLGVCWGPICFAPAFFGESAISHWLNTEDSTQHYSNFKLATGDISASFCEEFAKGIAVAALFVIFHKRINDVVSGIAVGIAVGIGFNLIETVEYAAYQANQTDYQVWLRQALGLPLGHPTFTAFIGAAFGIAYSQRALSKKITTILIGFCIAVFAHFVWDLAADLGVLHRINTHPTTFNLLIVLPLIKLAITGPFAAVIALIAIRGVRQQREILRTELLQEAESNRGAIDLFETPALYSSHQRNQKRRRAFLESGFAHYRNVVQLQRAQIDLAMWRWSARQHQELGSDYEVELRLRVLTLKRFVPEETW